MDEKDNFLSINKKKKRKKNVYNNYNSSINSKNQNPKKYYLIILISLIIINIFLFIKLIQSNKSINTKEIIDDNYYINITKFNNNIPSFSQIKRIFLYKDDILELSNTKNQIHISMAIDNKFIYPSLVSMTSACENNNKTINIIIYHLFLPEDFNKQNIKIFDSLKNNYEVKINYYIVPDIFSKCRSWVGGTNTIYYKILLPLVFHDFERIIYLDADTLIFKDLLEMYTLPFNDNYILGYPFHDVYKIDKFVKNATYYINGGVLLFNIEKIRKHNKDIELIRFTIENHFKLWFLEQDSINIIFSQKIGFLPLKYGIYMYGDIYSFEKSIQIRIRIKLNRTEVIQAIDDPSLVHFSGCNPKVWFKSSSNEFDVHDICKRFNKEFYYYANKTNYYFDIRKKYMG